MLILLFDTINVLKFRVYVTSGFLYPKSTCILWAMVNVYLEKSRSNEYFYISIVEVSGHLVSAQTFSTDCLVVLWEKINCTAVLENKKKIRVISNL